MSSENLASPNMEHIENVEPAALVSRTYCPSFATKGKVTHPNLQGLPYDNVLNQSRCY